MGASGQLQRRGEGRSGPMRARDDDCTRRPPSRPVWPEWSTEGQTRFRSRKPARLVFRSRKPAWPSVSIGLVPRIRVVRVDLSSQAQVQRTAARRGDRLITNSPCRCTMEPGRLPVESTHQMSPNAAVPWGGSFCFPLMAPRMTPEFDVTAILVASQQVCARTAKVLRLKPSYFVSARREL